MCIMTTTRCVLPSLKSKCQCSRMAAMIPPAHPRAWVGGRELGVCPAAGATHGPVGAVACGCLSGTEGALCW